MLTYKNLSCKFRIINICIVLEKICYLKFYFYFKTHERSVLYHIANWLYCYSIIVLQYNQIDFTLYFYLPNLFWVEAT